MLLMKLKMNKSKLTTSCSRFAKASPVFPPSLPPSVLRGRPQRYLGPLPEGPADSAERARLGGDRGRDGVVEGGTSISLQNDKLTLGQTYVSSRFIISLAAPLASAGLV